MIDIKHFLKSLQEHGIITKESETSEIKKYKVESGFVIMYKSKTVAEISYDRTMSEFLWIFCNIFSWKQLTISEISYDDFSIYKTLEIF
jgi:hypothetical protein